MENDKAKTPEFKESVNKKPVEKKPADKKLIYTILIVAVACAIAFAVGFIAGRASTQIKVQKPEKTTEATAEDTTVKAETTAPQEVTAQIVTEEEEETESGEEPDDDDFVKITDYAPTIRQELAYATKDNFTKQVVYDFEDAYIRYGTMKKLMAVQEDLAEHGVGLVIWDAFRPVSGQRALWEAYPDPNYVAKPEAGGPHCRGNTVDVTLCDLKTGELLEMPTDFDEFSTAASTDFSDDPPEVKKNAQLLFNTMVENGFQPYSAEWWHYQDTDSYEVEKEFDPAKAS